MTFKYCWCYCFRGGVCLCMLLCLFALCYCFNIMGTLMVSDLSWQPSTISNYLWYLNFHCRLWKINSCCCCSSSLSCISSFFVHPLLSELSERNSVKTGHMLGSECDLKTHVRNLWHHLPYKSGAQNPPFSTTSQLNGSLKAYISGKKHDIDNRASALATKRGLLHRLETTWPLVHKRL